MGWFSWLKDSISEAIFQGYRGGIERIEADWAERQQANTLEIEAEEVPRLPAPVNGRKAKVR